MTTALDTVRYNCGMAGEEVANAYDELDRQVMLLTKQRNELLAALTLIATGEEVNGCIPSLGWAVDIADNAIASVKEE